MMRKEVNGKTRRMTWKELKRKRNGRKDMAKLKSKELSTRGSAGQKKRMKARRNENHGKKEDGSARRTTTKKTGKDILALAKKRNTTKELTR